MADESGNGSPSFVIVARYKQGQSGPVFGYGFLSFEMSCKSFTRFLPRFYLVYLKYVFTVYMLIL